MKTNVYPARKYNWIPLDGIVAYRWSVLIRKERKKERKIFNWLVEYIRILTDTPSQRKDRKGKSYGAVTTFLVGTRSIGPPLHHHRHSTHHRPSPLEKLSDRSGAIDPTVSPWGLYAKFRRTLATIIVSKVYRVNSRTNRELYAKKRLQVEWEILKRNVCSSSASRFRWIFSRKISKNEYNRIERK